jgi:hypothetical protein
VSSAKGSGEHASHPLSGDHVVDRWHNVEYPDKSGSS